MSPGAPLKTLWLLVITAGCSTWLDRDDLKDRLDADGDGYTTTTFDGPDCDDEDASVHPGALELCDGLDSDCDGLGDEDVWLTFYADVDGDGLGDEAAPQLERACDPVPQGFVTDVGDCDDGDPAVGLPSERYDDLDGDGYGDGEAKLLCPATPNTTEILGDCDDGDASVYPGAPETCSDAEDKNCDGSVGRVDLDGDGHIACEECDDSDAAISPDADEICDGQDNDCDGLTDDEDDSVGAGRLTYYLDGDGDGHGAGSSRRACEPPAGSADTDDDCDDTNSEISPSHVERCDTTADDDCDGATTDCAARLDTLGACAEGVSVGDEAGRGVDGVDLNLDGAVALSIGAPGANGGGGRLYLVGPDAARVDEGDELEGGGGSGAGALVLTVPDFDGDGHDDLAVAAPDDDAVHLLLAGGGAASLGGADVTLRHQESGAALGAALSVGEVQGDGRADLLIGAPGVDAVGLLGLPVTDSGAVYLLIGAASSSAALNEANAALTLLGEDSTGGLGAAVALSDWDNDGLDEPLASNIDRGSLGLSNNGEVLLFSAVSGEWMAQDAEFVLSLGSGVITTALAGSGDLNGDGKADLAVGSTDSESVWVLLGPITKNLTVSSSASLRVKGDSGDGVGASARFVPDLDGDGDDELLIGAPEEPGAVLIYGGAARTGTINTSAADLRLSGDVGDGLGAAFGLGDLDGDGADELLFGLPGLDGDRGGACWLDGQRL
ncbi:MAG: putative metal-binding motif-containing protein [Deltaproteobacteria bacterium]|nr:putative metal-binding motif-containing protein [Deltaproteobacteria bacterium]